MRLDQRFLPLDSKNNLLLFLQCKSGKIKEVDEKDHRRLEINKQTEGIRLPGSSFFAEALGSSIEIEWMNQDQVLPVLRDLQLRLPKLTEEIQSHGIQHSSCKPVLVSPATMRFNPVFALPGDNKEFSSDNEEEPIIQEHDEGHHTSISSVNVNEEQLKKVSGGEKAIFSTINASLTDLSDVTILQDLYKSLNQRSMDWKLLYGVAYGDPWFGRWRSKLCHGSFGITEHNYFFSVSLERLRKFWFRMALGCTLVGCWIVISTSNLNGMLL